MSDIVTLPSVSDYAKGLIDKGFAIYPCYGSTTKIDGKKKAAMMPADDPFYKTGVPYDVFIEKYYREGVWIGVRCGAISGNLECLDFDNKFGDAVDVFREYVSIPDVANIIETYGLFVEETVSGGRHLVYRCNQLLTPIPDGGKLARRFSKEKNKTFDLIETRTEGQYFVTYPSAGYIAKQDLSLLTMEPIDLEARNFLIEMSRAMNEYDDPKKMYLPAAPKGKSTNPNNANDLRPGDDYDQSEVGLEEMVKFLKDAGWRHLGSKYWQRPGKDDGGISATLGHVAHNVFYVFSSNADPFEAGRCYKPFGVMTLLFFDGDFSECARHLASRKFGSQESYERPLPPNAKNIKQAMRIAKDILKRIKSPDDLGQTELALIAQGNNITLDEAQECFDEIYKRNKDLINFDSKHPLEQAEIMIKKTWVVRRNVIKCIETIKKRKDTKDSKEYTPDDIYLTLKKAYHKITKSDVDSILNSNFVEEFNPMHDYFNSLPEHKAGDRDFIKEYASYFKCTDPNEQHFWEEMFKKHLVRSLHCLLSGIENRYCVVLLGPQEDGKSTFIRNLCPDEDYYTQKDMFSSGNIKDSEIAQFENFFWQFEEIDALTNAQLNKLKAYISTPHDKVRDLYGRKAKLRIRIVTYWGTGNKDNILTDETGNSRFLVFRGRISSHDYNNRRTGVCTVPLERLWAQVFSLYKTADFEYELTKEEKEFRDRANKRYEVTNDTVSSVLDYFEPGPIFWSVTKIARYLAKESPIHKFSSAQLIAAFKKINEIYKEANKDKPENEQKTLYELEEVYGQKGFKVRLLEFSHGESNPF
jgi:hypothetical protein